MQGTFTRSAWPFPLQWRIDHLPSGVPHAENSWKSRLDQCPQSPVDMRSSTLPYEREDRGSGFRSTDDPAFLALNPNAMVPVLVDGDLVLWESNTICRYLCAGGPRRLAAKYAPRPRRSGKMDGLANGRFEQQLALRLHVAGAPQPPTRMRRRWRQALPDGTR
jgi:glutathione S-transferase